LAKVAAQTTPKLQSGQIIKAGNSYWNEISSSWGWVRDHNHPRSNDQRYFIVSMGFVL